MSLSLESQPTTNAFASHPAASLSCMAPVGVLNFNFAMIPMQCSLVLYENQ
jgi:hypothetical protein